MQQLVRCGSTSDAELHDKGKITAHLSSPHLPSSSALTQLVLQVLAQPQVLQLLLAAWLLQLLCQPCCQAWVALR
jgi:hypothetical protein